MIVSLIATAVFLQAAPTPSTVSDPTELSETLIARDAELFDVLFNRCEPEALARLVTADVEFYHDRGGAMFGRTLFVEDYERSCRARLLPEAWRSRRVLTPGTFHVYAIPGYGAVTEGAHTFNERRGDGPETPVGRARFSILWKLEDGQWRMARAFSIDHAPIEPTP